MAGADPAWGARVDVLDDGSYVAVLIDPKLRSGRRDRVLAAARAGNDIGDDGHFVRVVEYDVPDRVGNGSGELVVLPTTILVPASTRHERPAAINIRRLKKPAQAA